MEDRTLLATFLVSTTADSGPGSLRQAILDSDAAAGGTSTIDFAIAGPGVQTIVPQSPLPAITNPALIDGESQPGYAGTPLIQIVGWGAGSADGLLITGPDVTVRGLDIAGFYQGAGIHLSGPAATGDWIYGNFLGTDPTGSWAESNDEGVLIDGGASGNLVGTDGDGVDDASERDLLSGNSFAGVWITGPGTNDNAVAGDLIGTDVTGTYSVGNGSASATVDADGDTVGGGVVIESGASGNRIGTDGASVDDAGERNVISGNDGDAVDIALQGTDSNIVAGNFIGTDITGTLPLGNPGDAVFLVDGASGNRIGLPADGGPAQADEGNVIAESGAPGVEIIHGCDANVVAGNAIGTDAAGVLSLPNDWAGVDIEAGSSGNIIGGPGASAGNLIVHNDGPGVEVNGQTTIDNRILGNRIDDNTGQAIDLGDDGVTYNSTTPRSGPDDLQDFPIVVTTPGGQSEGWLEGNAPYTIYQLQFFASASYGAEGSGEAQDYLGSLDVATDGQGQAVFTVPFAPPAGLPIITATATDPEGNTSEVSALRRGGLDQPGETPRIVDGQPLAFSAAAGDAIALEDPDAGPLDPTWSLTLSTPVGTLTLPGIAGLTGSGNGTDALSYTGPLSAMNAALAGLTFTPPAGFHGNTTLSVAAQSDGATPVYAQVLVTDGVYTVTTTADGGPGSLRQAILDSDAVTGGTNTIDFDIPGPGVQTIALLSPLPAITSSVLVDGTSQPGYAGSPLIALDTTGSGSPDGLTIAGADLSLRGLAGTAYAFGDANGADELSILSAPRQVGEEGQVDSYRIDAASDTLLVASVHADGPSTRLELVDAQGALLALSDGISASDPDDGLDEHLAVGTYYLVVDSTGPAGDYTLTATLTPASLPSQGGPDLSPINGPEGMVAGDFNGDGIPDIATPGGVELGVGDGTFRSPSNGLPLPDSYDQYTAIAEGDFFDDGHLDLVLADATTDSILLLRGNGDGTFQAPESISVGPFAPGDFPTALAVGDFNGDGNLDLAVAVSGNPWEGGTDPGGVSVLLGNGNGTFRRPQVYAAGSIISPADLVAGSFGGDGRLDLAVTNFGSGTVTVLMGNGDGTFGPPTSIATGANPYSIATGDFGGDGRLDLAVNSGFDDVAVLLGNGDGTFRAPALYAAGYGPNSVVAGDFSGDGQVDLAVADAYDSSYVEILRGNGDGTFQPPQQHYAISDSNDPTLVAADFLGDGRLDLAETSTSTSGVSVLLQNPDGTFGAPGQAQDAVAADPNLIVAGDFNGDGKVDLIAVSENSSSLLLGNGDATFQAAEPLPFGDSDLYGQSISIATGDFNGDGREDVAIGDPDQVTVMLGDGDGTFQVGQTEPLPFQPSFLLAGELDDDGKLDLIAAAKDSGQVAVMMGNGDGTFQPATTLMLPFDPYAMVAGDFGGDGKLDLAAIGFAMPGYVPELAVLLGNGDGTFQPAETTVLPFTATTLVEGDFGGDGRLDLAAAGVAYTTAGLAYEVGVLIGNGDGTFQPARTYPLSLDPLYLEAGDFSSGGKTDLAVLGLNLSTAHLETATYVNNGDGAFQPATMTDLGPEQYLPGSNLDPVDISDAVTTGDLNGDGRDDLAFLNDNSNAVTVLMSNGDGTFRFAGQDVMNPRATPLVADVNGDGTDDVLVVDGAGDILYRQGIPGQPGAFEPPVTVNPGVPSRDIAWVPNTMDGPLLASVDAQDNAISLYAYRDGGFVRVGSLATGQLPAQIIAADLAGTGWDDLVVVNAGDGTLSVFRNNELGSFETGFDDPFLPPMTIPVGLGVSDVEAIDTSGDGHLDLVLTNELTGQVDVLANLGGGTFAPPVPYRAGTGLSGVDPGGMLEISGQDATAGVAAGPLTPGGPTDLVTINPGSVTMDVLAGVGGGRFANPASLPTQGPAKAVRMADLAGNGVEDLAVLTADGLSVYLGNGEGGFLPPTTYAVPSGADGLTVADLSQDGKPDLLVGDAYGDVLVLTNNGNGTFQPYREANQVVALAVADLTGNGSKDIIYADQGLDRVVVGYGAGNSAVLADQSTGLIQPGAVALADLNGDGIPDLIVANSGSNNVLIYPGLGNGQFGPAINDGNGYFVGTNPVGITVAYLTGPLPDLVIADEGSNQVSILLNQSLKGGAIAFSPGPRLNSGGSGPVSTVVGHFTGSPFPDLLVTNSGSNDVTLLPGVGQGFFNDQSPRVYSVGINPLVSFVGNFSGQSDLVTVNAGSNTLTIISGFTGSNPVVSTIPSGGLDPTTAFVFSTDDGYQDLVVGNSGDGALALFEGGPEGLSLVSAESEPDLPAPTALAFSALTGDTIEFYAATAGREAAALVSLSLSSSLTVGSGPGSPPPLTPPVQLVAVDDTSLPLVATVLTLTIPGPGDEFGPSLGAAEPTGIGSAAATVGMSLGQGPFSASRGGATRPEDAGDPGETGADATASPSALAPWERYALGVDEAIEELGRDGESVLVEPPAPPERANSPSAPGLPAPGPGLRSVPDRPSENGPDNLDRASTDRGWHAHVRVGMDSGAVRPSAHAHEDVGMPPADSGPGGARPSGPPPMADEHRIRPACVAAMLLAARWGAPRLSGRWPFAAGRSGRPTVRRRPHGLI